MSSEVYKLAISLDYKDNASKGIASTVSQLQKLQNEGKQTISVWNSLQKTVNKGFSAKTEKLFSQLQKIQTEGKQTISVWNSLQKGVNKDFQSKGFSSLLKDLNKVQKESKETLSHIKSLQNTVSKGFSVKGEKLSDSVRTDKRGRRESPDEELDRVTGKRSKRGNYIDKLANVHDRVVEPFRQSADVWQREYDSLKKYTDETKKLYLAQAKFKLINLSPEQNQKAFDAVTKSVREMGLTTRAEGIEVLTDLHNVFGDLNSAIEAAPIASKYRFSMETLFGDKYSSSQLNEQIQNTFKFLELTDKVSKGRVEMEKWFDTMTRITASTGGRITGADFLNMGKTGGVAVQNLTPEGLVNMSTIMQELSGHRTGTSMMSLYQALVGGVMKQSAAERFDYFGLLDKSKIEYGKAQKISRVNPGAVYLGDPLIEDPLKAGDMLREAMRKKGVNVDDDKEVNKELAILFQNRNAQRLMSILMTQRDQVVKEANLAKNAMGNEGMFKIASEDELGKIKRFEKALVELKTEAGIPLIQIGTKLAQTFTPLLKFFAEHPTVTQWGIALLLGGKALKGLAETASILKLSGVSSFFSGTISQANSAGTALGNANTKAKGLKGTLQNLASSSAFKIGVGVVVAEAGIELLKTLVQHINEIDERIENTTKNAKNLREIYDNLAGRGLTYNQPGDLKGQKNQFDNYGKTFTETIKEGRTLETNLHPERAGWWEHYKNLTELPYGSYTGGKQFNPTVAAQRWSSQGITQRFSDPNVLAAAIANVLKGIPTKERPEDPNSETKPILNLGDIKLVLQALEKTTNKDNFQTALALAREQVYGEKRPETTKTKFGETKLFQTGASQQTIPPISAKSFQVGSLQNSIVPFLNTSQKLNRFQLPQFEGQRQPILKPINSTVQSLFNNQPFSAKPTSLGLPDFSNLTTNTNALSTSFAELSRQQNQQNQNAEPIKTFGQSLLDLQKPISTTNQNIFDLGDTSNNAVSPISKLVTAANGVIGGLNSVSERLANWQPPMPQVTTYSIGIPAGTSGSPVIGVQPPTKASGGTVLREGLVYVHAGEDIVPANVTRQYRQPKINSANSAFFNFAGDSVRDLRQSLHPRDTFRAGFSPEKSTLPSVVLPNRVIGGIDKRDGLTGLLSTGRDADQQRQARFEEVKNFAASSGGAAENVTINYSPKVTINGADKKAEVNFQAMLNEHAMEIDRIVARRMNNGRIRA